MREPRNPFRLRASEHIESDATFLRLFSPGVLDLLPAEGPLDKVHFLRSAEGGGKTSFLRLLAPTVLLTLHAYRKRDECKELYQRMRDLDVIGEDGPHLLGVPLSCARNYATLADLEIDRGRKDRLLFSLLNARIILATLRGALALKKLSYPADLDKLTVAPASADELPSELSFPCDGRELYEWAKNLEIRVCGAIDSLGPSNLESSPGHDSLVSLKIITPGSIVFEGTPISKRVLLMLDDVQKLTRWQRERLLQTVIEARSSVGVWIAERFEALSTDEMLSSGARTGRDYGEVVLLENYWRGNIKRFENLVLNVADRRTQSAADVEIHSFSSCLQSSLDGTEWQAKFDEAFQTVSARAKNLAGGKARFQDWIAAREQIDGTPRERVVAWRALEILIEREKRRAQKSLFDTPLPVETLVEKDDSAVRASATLFIAKEFGFPYYFGPTMLSKLASSNIEQFLWLAGDQFEEIVAAALIKKPTDLPAERQQAILLKASETLWDEIPKRVRHGREVRDFLEAIGRFSKWMTYKPTAPNDIGVNGIAISMKDRTLLMDRKTVATHQDFDKLAEIIASALAFNLLEPVLDYKVKGRKWMVLNLNRLLCVRFSLPPHYGMFKEKTLEQLNEWLGKGFAIPRKEGTLYE
jgi:hypothetical protein